MSERRGGRIGRVLYGLGEGLRIALGSIRTNLFRAGLTILGVAIGVLVVVVMAAMITGIRATVAEGFEAAGPRNLYVMRFDLSDVQLIQSGSDEPPWADNPPITLQEARRIDALPSIRRAVMAFNLQSPGGEGGITVSRSGTTITGVDGTGMSEAWTESRDVTFTSGRNFVGAEVAEARPVVVISQQLARDLFGSEASARGSRMRVDAGSSGSVPLTVVGVFDTGENLFEEQTDHSAIVPHSTALHRMNVSDQWGELMVVPRDDVPLDVAEDEVIGALRSARGLPPARENDFAVLRSTQLLGIFDQFTAVFFAVMLALSSIGLMVGGVGVVGIMMISVTERTREIGIRKAVGATRPEILWQFLVESAVLTVLGGAAGLAVGAGVAFTLTTFTPIPAAIPLWAVIASLVMAALTGILFGLLPAARAAKMEPVRALRYE